MTWYDQIEVEIAQAAVDFIKADATQLEKDLEPYVKSGEQSVINAAKKVSPLLGMAVEYAVNYLGKDLPKYEGDAVAWIEATIEAFIANKQGG